jgi:hypothetical protein
MKLDKRNETTEQTHGRKKNVTIPRGLESDETESSPHI